MEKDKKEEIYKRIDEILYYLWDPIGVNDEPAARSEYTSYVSSFMSILEKHDDVQAIAKRLNQIEKTNMGLGENEKKAKQIAELIIDAKEAIIEGLS